MDPEAGSADPVAAAAPVAAAPDGGGTIASSALLSTVGIGVQGVSRLAYTVLIGRFFGTETLGHATALLSLSIFVALLWPTPAGNTASRFIALALRRHRSDAALTRVLGRSFAVSALVLAAATVPIAFVWGNGWGTALAAAWVVVGYGAYAYTRGAQLGYGRAPRVALWDSVGSVLSLGLLVVVCVTHASPLVLVPIAVGYTVFAAACWPRGNRHEGDEEPTGGALGFAGWNVLAGLTTNGLLQLTMIAATVFGDARATGVFAAAFTLATPASMLGQAVSQIIIPAFAHRSEGAGLRARGPLLLFLSFSGITAVVFGLVAVLAPWYLPVFYPAEGAAAVGDLQFLMLGVWVFTIALIPAALLLAAGRSRSVALTSIGGFVVGVGLMAALGPSGGVAAGSVGFLVGSLVNLVAMVVLGLGVGPRTGTGVRPATGQSSRRATAQ